VIESLHNQVETDEIDRSLLNRLQTDGRVSNVELARQVNLSPPAVHARIKRLERQGYIRDYVALLDREVAGYDMLCLINVRMENHQREHVARLGEVVQEMPEVLECYHLTGEYDFLLKVVVRNRKELERFLVDRLSTVQGLQQIRTSLVLSEMKASTVLPLD
jgi:DNA-binding Lrp family transcriptional regulator